MVIRYLFAAPVGWTSLPVAMTRSVWKRESATISVSRSRSASGSVGPPVNVISSWTNGFSDKTGSLPGLRKPSRSAAPTNTPPAIPAVAADHLVLGDG